MLCSCVGGAANEQREAWPAAHSSAHSVTVEPGWADGQDSDGEAVCHQRSCAGGHLLPIQVYI